MNVVATLPKDQLAEMAESLVSLTTLKRRVSSEEETVGGPTDVALITKGDGLIWIKRKHYFSPELNPSYFARTSYRRSCDIFARWGMGAEGYAHKSTLLSLYYTLQPILLAFASRCTFGTNSGNDGLLRWKSLGH